ncbi:Hypp3421 [Branchiostoma lanceolatum]|uniref:Hypp3421 protein n=1 Tax=Branchiostoma lanceolatum TaxID=7740 RepID=A0A8K0ES17_BRALA|nr:Hypp3421 [Branchiostoma lanceolatum]
MPENRRKEKKGPDHIGEECEAAGITLEVLLSGWNSPEPRRDITELMVAEIEAFHVKNKQKYGTKDIRQWLERLLGPEAFEGVSEDSVRGSVMRLWKRASDAKKNRKKKGMQQQLDGMRTNLYRPT